MEKNEIIEQILKQIDIDLIIRKYRINNVDEMRQIVLLILLEKPIEWLELRMNNNVMIKTISSIIKNLKNDERSTFHKSVDLIDEIKINKFDKCTYEKIYPLIDEELENIDNILDEVEKFFNEEDTEFYIYLYKDYKVNHKTLRCLCKQYNLNIKTIKKNFLKVEQYCHYILLKRIETL